MVAKEKREGDLSDQPPIFLRDVSTKYYGEREPAIYGINLEVGKGELALVVGPNGAGKTTLLETALGLLPHFRGEVKILGKRIPEQKYSALKFVSYVPQDFIKGPEEPFTALQVVLMGLSSIRSSPSRFSDEEVELGIKALERVGMEEFWDRPIGKLSGGQQQRIYLARALVRDPMVFLLDEPFSSIDEEWRRKISKELEREKRKGKTLVIVSHYELEGIEADVLIKMKEGRIYAVDRR